MKLFTCLYIAYATLSGLNVATTSGAHAADVLSTLPKLLETSIVFVDTPGFSKAWKTVISKAGIVVDKVYVRHTLDYRKLFREGKISMECCMAEEWRQDPLDISQQIFSDTFYVSEERFIFRKGEVVPITSTEQIHNMRFATVHGFNYTFPLDPQMTVEANSIKEVLSLLHNNQADVALTNKALFLNITREEGFNLEYGGIKSTVDIKVRVHKSRADLLPTLNASIAKLRKDDYLKNIIEHGK